MLAREGYSKRATASLQTLFLQSCLKQQQQQTLVLKPCVLRQIQTDTDTMHTDAFIDHFLPLDVAQIQVDVQNFKLAQENEHGCCILSRMRIINEVNSFLKKKKCKSKTYQSPKPFFFSTFQERENFVINTIWWYQKQYCQEPHSTDFSLFRSNAKAALCSEILGLSQNRCLLL